VASRPPLGFSLCNTPAWVLSDWEFNTNPHPVEIDGVRIENRRLFDKLSNEPDPHRRSHIFNEYMSVKFRLHDWADHNDVARLSLKNSYVRFLRRWSYDSSTPEGAVLKAWVESRFGIAPTFHSTVLGEPDSEAARQFAIDRMKGSTRTNAIHSQLDLLYEFTQFEIEQRFGSPTQFTLFRGTNDKGSHPIIENFGTREYAVGLNNLCSFTSDRECAWEFGSTVWQTIVASPKVFYFSGLLPDSVVKGESEYLVIGGAFRVKELLW